MSDAMKWIWANIFPLSIVLSACFGAAAWAIRMRYATRVEIEALVDERLLQRDTFLKQHSERIAAVEAICSKSASKDDVGQILLALERQDGERRTLGAKVDGINDLLRQMGKPLDMIQEYLMTAGK